MVLFFLATHFYLWYTLCIALWLLSFPTQAIGALRNPVWMPLSALPPWPLLPLSLQSSKDGFNRQFTCNSCVLSFSCGFRYEKVLSFRMTMVWFWLVNESGVYGGMKPKVGFWWANPRRKMAPQAHHSGLGPEAASGCSRTRFVCCFLRRLLWTDFSRRTVTYQYTRSYDCGSQYY